MYIAFRNGNLLSDTIVQNLINFARLGHITEAGRELMLYPDRRRGRTTESGLRHIDSIQKSEGVPLSSFLPDATKPAPDAKKARRIRCAFAGCRSLFMPKTRRSKYCGRSCQEKAARRASNT